MAGEPSAPCSVEQVHPVAGLESPGQMHSHAWGPGGGLSQGPASSPGGLRASLGPLQQGIRLLTEWLRLAQGAVEQKPVFRDRMQAASLLWHKRNFCHILLARASTGNHPGSGDQTPPHDQRHVGKPAAFSACPRTVENIQSAPSHFSLFALSTRTFLRNPLHFANLQMRLILLMSALSPFSPF